MGKRKPITKTMRFEIFKRDGFTCQYCGAHPPQAVLQVEHIVPVSKGGTNDDHNLTTACQPCNLGKGVRDLKIAPQSLSERAAMVAEQEEQLAGYNDILNARRMRIEDDVWDVVDRFFGQQETTRSNFQSIKTFVERLGVHRVLDAVDIADGQRRTPYHRWRYFCGVCWNMIRDMEAGR